MAGLSEKNWKEVVLPFVLFDLCSLNQSPALIYKNHFRLLQKITGSLEIIRLTLVNFFLQFKYFRVKLVLCLNLLPCHIANIQSLTQPVRVAYLTR